MIIPIEKDAQSEAAAIVTLTLLAARCVAGLAFRPDAIRLLSDAGIIDAATIAAFGVGAGDTTLLDDVTDDQRQQLTPKWLRRSASILSGSSFVITTRDPRDYIAVLGFVKVSPAQLKHAQTGAPIGSFRSRSTDSNQGANTDTLLSTELLHRTDMKSCH